MPEAVLTDDERKSKPGSAPKGARWTSSMCNIAWRVYHHARKHTGVGIICSVAYFDPGNWGVDLQAGSQYGYSLLFCVLLAGLFAAFLQVLACRLGVVTGLDLASHCRILFHDRPRHKILWRWGVLYPLYALSEVAIISTDLAEMLGSAIALVLLFPSLPLWAGVLLTASDVMVILAFDNPLRSRPVKLFEYLISALVLAVLICMALIIARINVDWGNAFKGLLPSKALFGNGALYTTVGILGATIMPHSLFLGSHLATQDRVALKEVRTRSETSTLDSSQQNTFFKRLPTLLKKRIFCCDDMLDDDPDDEPASTRPTTFSERLRMGLRRMFSFLRVDETRYPANVSTHTDRENNSLEFVRAHIYHGMSNMVLSLLGFAVIINALILILASAVFYYASGAQGSLSPATLFDAHTLIKDTIGKPAALLFALALLASGQSASIVATLAGQSVSEGFLRWKVSPIVRRLLTRLLGLIPSMIVAIAVGESGISALLVISQVVLSIVLPFITFPLIYLTSSSEIMKVRQPPSESSCGPDIPSPGTAVTPPPMNARPPMSEDVLEVVDRSLDPEAAADKGFVYFNSGKMMSSIGILIWLVIVAANIYALVTLGSG
ncbi:natural resistance-associated macrophage protein-domain-containing protein [Scleroderma yunnanense]